MRTSIVVAAVALMAAGAWSAPRRYAPPPNTLQQYQADGSTIIPQAGSATSSTVVLSATLGTGSTTGQQRLRVEVKPVDQNFTGTISGESEILNDGDIAYVTVAGLAGGDYKWRAWGWCT